MDNAEPTSHSYTSQRLRLNYVDWGNPEKPPLLMVHGGLDHSRNWDWTARALRGDWHVIAVDLRGHGDSEWVSDGNYLSADMACDIAELVEHLELAPVTLLGHSLGGHVCVHYAAAFPEKVRKLAVIEGLGDSPEAHHAKRETPYHLRAREWMEQKRASTGRTPRLYESVEAAARRMQEEHSFLTEEQVRLLTRHGVRRVPDGGYTWKFDPGLYVFGPEHTSYEDLEAAWAAITCPVLLMYGAQSWASDPAKDGRAAHFRDVRTILFDGAGHWLHHHSFEPFIDAVQEFL